MNQADTSVCFGVVPTSPSAPRSTKSNLTAFFTGALAALIPLPPLIKLPSLPFTLRPSLSRFMPSNPLPPPNLKLLPPLEPELDLTLKSRLSPNLPTNVLELDILPVPALELEIEDPVRLAAVVPESALKLSRVVNDPEPESELEGPEVLLSPRPAVVSMGAGTDFFFIADREGGGGRDVEIRFLPDAEARMVELDTRRVVTASWKPAPAPVSLWGSTLPYPKSWERISLALSYE